MPNIRFAQMTDLTAIYELDHHLVASNLGQKIESNEILVVEVSSRIIGILRFSMFWDEIPFINMLRIRDAYQSRGFGRALVQEWENEMLKLGHTKLLTSTQADEEAQYFYRKIGYIDIGGFVLPSEPLEIIFFKAIG
jgi:GNAT superfamily N-acetyltransferase